MKEVYGNLWEHPADVRIITTNGRTRKDGRLVMGRGCAREAKDRYPGLDKILGDMVRRHGNTPVVLFPQGIGTFPVKHNWWEKGDPDLIVESARALVEIMDRSPECKTIVLPRPGCGNGQLNWSDVKPLIEDILDDRFHVITFPRGVAQWE